MRPNTSPPLTLDSFAPGEQRTVRIPVRLDALSWGKYNVQGNVVGYGPQATFETTTTTYWWGWFVVLLVLANVVFWKAVRRHARHAARRRAEEEAAAGEPVLDRTRETEPSSSERPWSEVEVPSG